MEKQRERSEWNEVAYNLPTWIWIGEKLREAGISTKDQASVKEACRLALRPNDEWGYVAPDVEKLALEIQRLRQKAPPLDQLPTVKESVSKETYTRGTKEI